MASNEKAKGGMRPIYPTKVLEDMKPVFEQKRTTSPSEVLTS